VRIEFSKTAISGIISKDEEEKGSD